MPESRLERYKKRIEELNCKISEYPHWGAALTEMDEERRSLQHAVAALEGKDGNQ